jgi:hypothetical protein
MLGIHAPAKRRARPQGARARSEAGWDRGDGGVGPMRHLSPRRDDLLLEAEPPNLTATKGVRRPSLASPTEVSPAPDNVLRLQDEPDQGQFVLLEVVVEKGLADEQRRRWRIRRLWVENLQVIALVNPARTAVPAQVSMPDESWRRN